MEHSIKNRRSIFRRVYDKLMPSACRTQLHDAIRENKVTCDEAVCVLRAPDIKEIAKKVSHV